MQTADAGRIGPFHLAPGITRFNFYTYLYASLICIAMLAGMNFFQGYVLTENLQIPRQQQGTITGNLGFWQEIIAIATISLFGVLSDRIGRRPIMIFALVMMGSGFALLPFSQNIAQLTFYRMVYALGCAGLAAVLAVVANDYTKEVSRGKVIGIGNLLNGLGMLILTAGLGRVPAMLQDAGMDPVSAGRVLFLGIGATCFISAVIFRFGLKGGTPAASHERSSWTTLITSGFRLIGNPRIALCYVGAFVARADLSIKGMFLPLWAIVAGQEAGVSAGESMARVGLIIGIMSVASMIWAMVFGHILDRVNRVTGMAIATALAGIGYSSMGWITGPTDFAMLPAFIVLAMGQTAMITASIVLVGQEAPVKERGAVIATNGLFGAVGILIAAVVGGRLFDAWGGHAPFVIVGVVQLVLCVVAVATRFLAPGHALQRQKAV